MILSSACESKDPGVLQVGDPVDINGDGIADGVAVDSNGDGTPDGVDKNGDGKLDVPFGGGQGDGDDGDDNDDDENDTWCDALAVIQDACQECHSANVDSTAPMPLDDYDDLIKESTLFPGQKVYERVKERIHDTRRPMPEPPRTLTSAQIAAIDAWIEDGAKPGPDPTCTPDPDDNGDGDGDDSGDGDGDGNGDGDVGGDGDGDSAEPDAGPGEDTEEWPEDCEEFYTLTAGNGSPHVVRAGVEEHPQFIFDAPWGSKTVQALAFRPITQNKKVIHHWILYDNSGGFGGSFLTGWAPGKDSLRTYPSDIGVWVPSGPNALRLDTHYYNLAGSQDEMDESGVEICVTTKPRQYMAATYAFTASATARPGRSENTSTCTVSNTNGPSYLLASSPHMHKLGVWAKFVRTRSGSDMILEDESFNFEFQDAKPLDRVDLADGDRVSTTCVFENPSGSTVTFGQNTDDEMCFNFALYYPRGNLNCTGGLPF